MKEENSSEEEIRITRSELEEIIDRRVEQKLKEEKETEKHQPQELSRRKFLKMAGLGAGAIGLTSATSALNFSPLGGGASKQSYSSGSGLDLSNQKFSLDESYSADWTTLQTFESGIDSARRITAKDDSFREHFQIERNANTAEFTVTAVTPSSSSANGSLAFLIEEDNLFSVQDGYMVLTYDDNRDNVELFNRNAGANEFYAYIHEDNANLLNHNDLSTISSDDHHEKYTDTEAVSAVNSENSLSVNISGDADTVDGNHANDFASFSTNSPQDVSSSRSKGTTYTNNSNNPLFVSVSLSSTFDGGEDGHIEVDGVIVDTMQSNSNNDGRVQAVVPPNSTYSVTSEFGQEIPTWIEYQI
ncbi:MAG: hypothetical protein ACI8Z7_000811 [Candidatus Nanohaloarchaea archaeon]|jgi:hypothetical protein